MYLFCCEKKRADKVDGQSSNLKCYGATLTPVMLRSPKRKKKRKLDLHFLSRPETLSGLHWFVAQSESLAMS